MWNNFTRILPVCVLALMSCVKGTELETVQDLDLNKYCGTWFEIERFPHRFERNLQCVSATYSLVGDGTISVYNRGYNFKKAKWTDITGSAKVPRQQFPGEIKVSFFKPFSGDYFVIDIDDGYQSVLIGSPSRKYLWILSRNVSLSEDRLLELRSIAKERGFDISKLESVKHNCEKHWIP